MPNPVLIPVLGAARKLRFPWLLGITATLFVLDVLTPDFIPFVDEILLGLATLIFASWKERRAVVAPAPLDDRVVRDVRPGGNQTDRRTGGR